MAPDETPALPETPPPAAGDGSSPAINSVTVDPGDGTIMIGSGPALFRLAAGAEEAERITGKLSTPQGEGTVSGNLVVRYAGKGDLLALGPPAGGRTTREPGADPVLGPGRYLDVRRGPAKPTTTSSRSSAS